MALRVCVCVCEHACVHMCALGNSLSVPGTFMRIYALPLCLEHLTFCFGGIEVWRALGHRQDASHVHTLESYLASKCG